MQQNSLQKSKGGRKRLNSQAAENVEKRRSVNLNKCETQVYNFFFLISVLLCIVDMSKKSVFFLGRQISHLLFMSCINIHIIEIFICMMQDYSFWGGEKKNQLTKPISINLSQKELSFPLFPSLWPETSTASFMLALAGVWPCCKLDLLAELDENLLQKENEIFSGMC